MDDFKAFLIRETNIVQSFESFEPGKISRFIELNSEASKHYESWAKSISFNDPTITAHLLCVVLLEYRTMSVFALKSQHWVIHEFRVLLSPGRVL